MGGTQGTGHALVLGAAFPLRSVLLSNSCIFTFQTREQACEADTGASVGGKGFA